MACMDVITEQSRIEEVPPGQTSSSRNLNSNGLPYLIPPFLFFTSIVPTVLSPFLLPLDRKSGTTQGGIVSFKTGSGSTGHRTGHSKKRDHAAASSAPRIQTSDTIPFTPSTWRIDDITAFCFPSHTNIRLQDFTAALRQATASSTETIQTQLDDRPSSSDVPGNDGTERSDMDTQRWNQI